MWVIVKDWKRLSKYRDLGMIEGNGSTYSKELRILIIGKVLYLIYTIAIPILFIDIAWYQWLGCFFTIHFVAGFILAAIFQMAHIIEEVDQPLPDADGKIDNLWAVHQLQTTANFSTDNLLLNWYAGGLNFQVEHHLFPKICHIHYKPLSKIVKETALEYGVPYHEMPTFMSAVRSHLRLLKKLGSQDKLAAYSKP